MILYDDDGQDGQNEEIDEDDDDDLKEMKKMMKLIWSWEEARAALNIKKSLKNILKTF